MIISVNWLKKYTDIDIPVDELATLIGARLVEIEEVIRPGDKYKCVVVAKVVSCEKLENSDHLNVTKLDDAGVVPDVERDENGLVQVVCGAPNVRAGIFVAWLPPKTVVPETHDGEPFVLEARKLRGVMSNGMIASPRELALFDDHEGILEIGGEVMAGESFAEVFELDDILLDIENKSLTHRPDTFGVVGFAREVAGIQGKQFTTPEWLKNIAPLFESASNNVDAPKVTIDDPVLSDRYQGVVIENVDGTSKTPLSIQTYLARVGMRPISAIVDVTNYLMLETGQPLHAFDYDKLAAVNNGVIDIHVRAGREDETLALLDGRTVMLSTGDIVIANGDTAVALAGAMGGASTEVDDSTKRIFLESATFNLYNLRTTQMRHGIFSEAITRFTKGQPGELTAPVLAKALAMLHDFMGAAQASEVVEDYPGKKTLQKISISSTQINDTLGSTLSIDEMKKTLGNVEFEVAAEGNEGEILEITPPYWRNDIHIAEDIIEEVGRLNGFDSIAPVLPSRDFVAVRPSTFDELRANLRRILQRTGANEVLSYSFVHGDVLRKAHQKVEDSYRIVNSISPDLQHYRQSLTPSLLSLIHRNVKQGYSDFALFEINKAHPKTHGLTDENVPNETNALALTVTRQKGSDSAPYYQARRLLDYIAFSLGLEFDYTSMESDPGYPLTAPYEYRRSAMVTEKNSGVFIGVVGEFKKPVSRAFKLPDYSAGFEVGTEALHLAVRNKPATYTPTSRYPGTERDICFQVDATVSYAQIIETLESRLNQEQLETSISPIDIYQPEGTPKKNITVRIVLISHEKTLTSEEANTVIDGLIKSVMAAVDATVV